MDRESVRTYISNNLDPLYSFAYALIPDELFAQQLLVDSLTQILCSEKQEEMSEKGFERELYKSMFMLAEKRSHHVSINKNWLGDAQAFFYEKPVRHRAILFLKEQHHLSFHDVSYILQAKHEKVHAQYLQLQMELARELRVGE